MRHNLETHHSYPIQQPEETNLPPTTSALGQKKRSPYGKAEDIDEDFAHPRCILPLLLLRHICLAAHIKK